MPEADPSFTRAFLGEVALRTGLGLAVMLVAGGGAALGSQAGGAWGPFAGAVTGTLLGIAAVVLVLRRRRQSPVATGRDESATHSLQEPG